MRLPSLALAACLAFAASIAAQAADAPATPKHASTISGTVTRSADASAVVGADVLVLTPAGDFVTFAVTGPGGTYTVDPGPGTFLVLVAAQRLVTEIYDDVSCPAFECDIGLATQIPLAHGGAVTGIDFALAAQPKLTGVVTGGSPVVAQAGVDVIAATPDGNVAGSATTAADGSYELFFDPVPVLVRTSNPGQLVDELHPDIPCPFGTCGTTGATVFTLAAGQTQGGVDFVLAPGASIGGEVTLAANGQPVPFANISLYAADATFLGNLGSGADGTWRVGTGLPPGTYRAAVENNGPLQSEVWNDHACAGACDIAGGDPIVVTAGQTRSDIDFALVRGTGVLSGTVRRFGTNAPLFDARLELLSSNGVQLVAQAQTAFDGTWSIEIEPGTYILRAAAPGLAVAEELYPGIQCLGGFFICAGEAQPITIAASQDIANLDFALAPVATLTALARSADTNAELDAEWIGRVPGFDTPLQRFSTPGAPAEFFVLNGGDVRIAARSNGCGAAGNEICLAERWPNDPCPALRCDLATGTSIPVAKGATVTGIELSLAAGARIAGTLTEAAGGAPVAGAVIDIVDINRVPITNTATDTDGTYTAGGLGSGPYYVFAHPPAPLLGELYDDVTCPNSSCVLASGTTIPTTPGATTSGIDFALVAGGTISGDVGSDLGAEIGGATVTVFDGTGAQVGAATTSGDGTYETTGLVPGNYFVRFTKPGFGGVLYNGIACADGNCNPATGTPVPVVAGQATSGIDAIMPSTGQPGPPQVVYLNRCAIGCVLHAGNESAINNTSSIISGTRTLGPYPFSDASFAAFTQCVRETFARYQIEITTNDPGNVPHREHMVGGTPAQLGFSSGVAGVSPFTCASIPNSISFTFAAAIGDDIHELCWTAAQEIAHGFGLDHEFHPPDAMSYIDAPTKGFTPETVPCGEYSARPCVCGAPTQNSSAFLAQSVGLNAQLFRDGFEDPVVASSTDWKTYRSPHAKIAHDTPMTCGVDPVESMQRLETQK